MLINESLLKALVIIEDILKAEYVSCEIFSDGSGQIVNDKAELVIDWNNVDKLEDKITEFINRRGRK